MEKDAEELLTAWISRRAVSDTTAWLQERVREARRMDAQDRRFDAAFARVPRLVGDGPLALDESELAEAARLREGWCPCEWSLADAARALLLTTAAQAIGADAFARLFRRLRQTGDPAEQAALFRSLPLYGDTASLADEAAEALRANIPAVFAALVHWSPYPCAVFDEARWNQMILKALFVGCALEPIRGLDARANPRLAASLRDLLRERIAAGRPPPRDIERCLMPFTGADVPGDPS